jgi:hypothetical protein
MRSRLRCPSSVLAGPRRRTAGAVTRAAGWFIVVYEILPGEL